jgi:hypothetical protein
VEEFMSRRFKLTGWLMTGFLCLPVALCADTQNAQSTQNKHHPIHKKKEAPLPPPLPSGTRGPVPQVPLESLPAVAPDVTYQDGLLTIVAPNSTLGDILRSVRKHTSAEIDVPPTASERVVTRLGPAPAREVVAELLNGSHFNYILLGSPEDVNALTRVVLVAKTGDAPSAPTTQAENAPPAPANPAAGQPPADPQEVETAPDDPESSDNASPENTPEAEQPANQGDQQNAKTPQQLLQEMQQRQMQQQGGPTPGMPYPHQPQPPQGQQPTTPDNQ